MNKLEARTKLNQACELIFEVEKEMDISKSNVRRLGYLARIEIAKFQNAIRQAKEELVKDIK